MIERRDRGRSCRTCDYWYHTKDRNYDAGPDDILGQCRAHTPPSLDNWPLSYGFEWCGEYKEAPGMTEKEDE